MIVTLWQAFFRVSGFYLPLGLHVNVTLFFLDLHILMLTFHWHRRKSCYFSFLNFGHHSIVFIAICLPVYHSSLNQGHDHSISRLIFIVTITAGWPRWPSSKKGIWRGYTVCEAKVKACLAGTARCNPEVKRFHDLTRYRVWGKESESLGIPCVNQSTFLSFFLILYDSRIQKARWWERPLLGTGQKGVHCFWALLNSNNTGLTVGLFRMSAHHRFQALSNHQLLPPQMWCWHEI